MGGRRAGSTGTHRSGRIARVLRRLRPFARPHQGLFVAAALLLLVSTAAQTTTVWLFGRLTDDALVHGATHRFLGPATAWLVVAVAGAAASYAGHLLQARASGRLLADLREAMLARLHVLSPAFFAAIPAGDLLTRFDSDLDAVDELAGSGLVEIATAVTGVICFTAAAFLLRWDLALLACAAAPLYWLLTRRLTARVQIAAERQRVAEGQLAAVVEENISAAALVQTHGMAAHEHRRLRRHGVAWFDARLVAYRVATANAVLATLLETVFVLAVLGVGSWEISTGRLTLGGLLSFAGFLGYLYGPVQELGTLVVSIGAATASGDRILELLDHPVEVRDAPDAGEPHRVHGQVRFDRVSVRFPAASTPVLDQVSFVLRPGQLTVLTGGSGAGKSTITTLLVRLRDPNSGHILLDGYDLRSLTLASLRRAVTVVAQDSPLLDGTLWANLTWGIPDATEPQVLATARAAGVDTFARALPNGYDSHLGQGGRLLSGGQRRRVAIARALLRDSPVLVLDEPTAGLDDRTAERLVHTLRGLAALRTVLVVTHDLRLAADADSLLVLDGGHLTSSPA